MNSAEDFFDQLRTHYSRELPFVVYRKPGDSTIQALIQPTAKLCYTSTFEESGFIFAPFSESHQAVLFSLATCTHLKTEVAPKLAVDKSPITTSSISLEGKDRHIALVRDAIKNIETTALQKVVVSRSQMLQVEQKDALETFKHLVYEYPSAMAYCWYHPKIGLWLGATPETLFRLTGKQLQTDSLAGTLDARKSETLVWGEKEYEEQQIVTDYIKNQLDAAGVVAIQSTPVETHQAGHLLHLKSSITGRMDASSIKNLVEVLHPTPAVCGFPTGLAKEFILSHEGYDREFYTGFFGEINLQISNPRSSRRQNVENQAYRAVKNTSHLFVNLRCMQWKGDQVMIYVGGGVTAKSDPKAEWQETVAKSSTMLEAMVK